MLHPAALRDRMSACIPTGVATKNLFVARAENAELWDIEGRRYVDFAAGIAVLNTGHRHPRVLEAVRRQMELFTHTCFHVAPYESYLRLAERLNALTPGTFQKKTMLVSTGAEAVENAVKIARSATRRPAVIAFSGAFHGRTQLAMALTGKISPYKKGFGPAPAGIFHAPFPNYSQGLSEARALEDLQRLFLTDVDPEDVAAIIVEPVQGEGGFNVAPPEFLRALRNLADQHGIVLIADEIQSGIARTGKLFAIEHSGVVPDLMTTAKGLAGGFPLAAVTGRAALMDAPQPGGLGGTFAGSPIGIAAADAVLDVVDDENLCERASHIGERTHAVLDALARDVPAVGDIRGIGAMQALELVKDRSTREPDAALTAAVVTEAQARGLILLSCGTSANVIRLLPPLTIADSVLQEGLNILDATVRSVSSRAAVRAVA